MAEHCLLYYITDRTAFPGGESARRQSLLEKISEATRAGVDYIQLREKDLPARELEALAREAMARIAKLKTENRQLATALLINSRTDVALAVGAHGVHLRSDDISPEEVRYIWTKCGATSRPDPLIALSCHTPGEVSQAAENGATFAVFGPVFEKKTAGDAAAKAVGGPLPPASARGGDLPGLSLLKQACQQKIPVLALGGVTLQNARSCLEAGAAGIAAIRLFQQNSVAAVAQRLRP